jgi:hypothetical protein
VYLLISYLENDGVRAHFQTRRRSMSSDWILALSGPLPYHHDELNSSFKLQGPCSLPRGPPSLLPTPTLDSRHC